MTITFFIEHKYVGMRPFDRIILLRMTLIRIGRIEQKKPDHKLILFLSANSGLIRQNGVKYVPYYDQYN
jgi:hypothetical protein